MLDTINASHSSVIPIKIWREDVNFISRVILGYGIIEKFIYFSANSKLSGITPLYNKDLQ